MEVIWALSIVVGLAGCFVLLKLPLDSPIGKGVRFQLADYISLGVLLQLQFAIQWWLDFAQQFRDQPNCFIAGVTITATNAAIWFASVRSLNGLNIWNGWQRLTFSAFLFPLIVLLSIVLTIAGAYAIAWLIWWLRDLAIQTD